MNPFKVQRQWKITSQYGLDGQKHEYNLPSAILYLLALLLLGLIVLAGLYLFNLRGLGKTNQALARVQKENLQLRHKIDYYSGIVDSIYQKLDSMQMLKKKSGSDPDYYPYYQSDKANNGLDNTFVYDSYLDARVNGVEQQLKQITLNLAIEKEPASVYKTDPQTGLLVVDNGPSIFPTFGRWSDGWGTRLHPITNNLAFHYGVDISNKMGTPIYATADGEIEYTGYDQQYGKVIKIKHAHDIETRYGHLYCFQVAQGDQVRKGEIIGMMGSSGISTGPHLHYEVLVGGCKVNPARYLNPSEEPVYYANHS